MAILNLNPTIIRFWKFVDQSPNQGPDGDCWEWQGKRLHFGHGRFHFFSGYDSARKKEQRAHRFSYMLHRGEIPKGLNVLHHCDNPPCVNPDHLFIGTNGDNNKDRARKGRTPKGSQHFSHTKPECVRRGESHGCHKLTDEQVVEIRNKYIPRVVTIPTLRDEYGVTYSTIQKIVQRKTWTHI
jgi:HNH endonuclease